METIKEQERREKKEKREEKREKTEKTGGGSGKEEEEEEGAEGETKTEFTIPSSSTSISFDAKERYPVGFCDIGTNKEG